MSRINRHNAPRNSFMLERSAGGWVIIGPDGSRTGGVYDNREYAETTRAALQRRFDRQRNARQRPCMCCGKTFRSEGIHNRLCDPCRGSVGDHANSFTDPAALALPRR